MFSFLFIWITNQGECYKHRDCSWDEKCVLTPLPVLNINSGIIFTFGCIKRAHYDKFENPKTQG